MPIIKNLVNPQTRQTIWFHRLSDLRIDRVNNLARVILSSRSDEKDYELYPKNPVSYIELEFGENKYDYCMVEYPNDDTEITKEYELLIKEWKLDKWISLDVYKDHKYFTKTVEKKEIYMDRNYVIDHTKSINEIYSDIYKKIEQFPDFNK